MVWESRYIPVAFEYGAYRNGYLHSEPTSFKQIQNCFVRKDHTCGKFLGASKSCFIACPSDDDIVPLLSLISEKLTKIGIEPVIAIKDRAYGQDIFCTKICGKIIESQFCLVILDDTIKKYTKTQSSNVPNPNVYYEYGLMTSLGKHLIPLQKSAQELAFNIQTHDTIKYTPGNLPGELDRAFKDAIKITKEVSETSSSAAITPRRLIDRSLEISGYIKQGYKWFLSDEIEDTGFTGYNNQPDGSLLFLSTANSKTELENCLTDIQVLIKRLESNITKLQDSKDNFQQLSEEFTKKIEEATPRDQNVATRSRLRQLTDQNNRNNLKLENATEKIESIQTSKFALILLPQVIDLKENVVRQYESIDKTILFPPLYVGDSTGIQIEETNITFTTPEI